MKVFVIALFATLIAAIYARPEDIYTSKYDNIDLDQILRSDRLLKNYVNCLLDKGRCGPDGAELKRVLPDALKNGCVKCNEKQLDGSKRIIRHLLKHKREWWTELENKFDPQHNYRAKYADELKNEGIVF